MTKKEAARIIKAIQRHKEAIGKHRDALRDLIEEAAEIQECCEDAYSSLENAVDTLSQYL